METKKREPEGAERGEWKKGAGKGRREWEWKGT
jgi:hypothetical protein